MKKKNEFGRKIITVGELIDGLQENFDRNRFVEVLTLVTVAHESDFANNTIRNLSISNFCNSSKTLQAYKERNGELDIKITAQVMKEVFDTDGGSPVLPGNITRVRNSMLACNINFVYDLTQVRRARLMEMPNVGVNNVRLIARFAMHYGIFI